MKVRIKIDDHFAEIDALEIEGDFAFHGSVEQNKIGYVAGTKLFTITHIPTGLSLISRIENKIAMKNAFVRIASAESFSRGLIEVNALKDELERPK